MYKNINKKYTKILKKVYKAFIKYIKSINHKIQLF